MPPLRKKIRLTYIYTVGLSFILIIFTCALCIFAVKSVKNFGENAISIGEENTTEKTAVLFWEVTRRTAGAYSTFFAALQDFVVILSETIQEKYQDVYFKKVKPDSDIKLVPSHDFFVNEEKDDNFILFWGEKENIAERMIFVNALCDLNYLFKIVLGRASSYVTDIWVHGRDFDFEYPRLDYSGKIKSKAFLAEQYNCYIASYEELRTNSSLKKPVLTRIYKDLSGFTLISIFLPIFDKNGEFLFSIGFDIDVNMLTDTLIKNGLFSEIDLQLSKQWKSVYDKMDGFLFIVDTKGSIIAFPEDYADMFGLDPDKMKCDNSFGEIRVSLKDSSISKVRELAEVIQSDDIGITNLNLKDAEYIITYSKIKPIDCILCYASDKEPLLESMNNAEAQLKNTEYYLTKSFIIIAVIFLIISIIACMIFFKVLFLNPINNISKGIKKLAKGDFHLKIKENGAAEIAELSVGFNYLSSELVKYIDKLRRETSARQAFETELQIAADIQRSILPKKSVLKKENRIEFSAQLNAANNVSGDYYDVFYLNENKLAILIADVSGKGVPSAFFMAMSKAMIKNFCMLEPDDPGKALTKANKSLSMDNEAQMFVTVFLTYIDFIENTIYYTNAGHHPALKIRDSKIKQIGDFGKIILGITDDAVYNSETLKLKKGDLFLLYTDGIVEAVGPEHEEFGTERLYEILEKNMRLPVENICSELISETLKFEQERRFDDITLVAFKIK